MTATLTTRPITETIDALRDRWQADRDAAVAALNARGLEIVENVNRPPSDAELRSDFWYAAGKLDALDDLRDELD